MKGSTELARKRKELVPHLFHSCRLDLPQEVSVQAFLYCSVRDAISAAVRLNLLGPLQAAELSHVSRNILFCHVWSRILVQGFGPSLSGPCIMSSSFYLRASGRAMFRDSEAALHLDRFGASAEWVRWLAWLGWLGWLG